MFSFVETKLFTRLVQEYLSDDEYAQLQQSLIANPETGAVIPASGGVRKMRWGLAGRGSAEDSASFIFCAPARDKSGC